MKSVVASMQLDDLPGRAFAIPATRNVSFIYVFERQEVQLGALAVSPAGTDFAPGSVHQEVLLDFWADDEWTEIVQPGAAFTVWYGGEIGRGVILRDR